MGTQLESVNCLRGYRHPEAPGGATQMQFRAPEYELEDVGHAVRITRNGVTMRVYASQVSDSVEAQAAETKGTKASARR